MKILPDVPAENLTLENIFGGKGSLVQNVIDIAAYLAGGLAVILIIVGAFYYLTAFGSEEKAQKGKTIIMWAIIGIIVIMLAEIAIRTIQNLLI